MDASTPRHPIRVVARRTGLSTVTLRAWERRYGVVSPVRSEGGQRLYSDGEVERLAMLRALTSAGRSIGSVADLPDPALRALLDEDGRAEASRPDPAPGVWEDGDRSAPGGAARLVDSAYAAILGLDALELEGLLRRGILMFGAVTFMDHVVTPLLVRVGDGWAAGEVSPAQEHFGSDVLDRVLQPLAVTLAPSDGLPRLVVATLQGERHGFGARLVAAAATAEGWSAVFLGVDLPGKDIASAAVEVEAEVVAVSVVSTEGMRAIAGSLATLRELVPPSVALLVGGRGTERLRAEGVPPGVEVVRGLDGLRRELRRRAV